MTGSCGSIAVLFIDDPLTPIRPWEIATFGSPSRRFGFWRAAIAIRRTGGREGIQHTITPHSNNADEYSRKAWDQYGLEFRTIAAKLAPASCGVYCVQHDPTNEEFRNRSLSSPISYWELVLPQTIGETRAFASGMTCKEFPRSDWPGFGWLSGAGLFFDEGCESTYERRLSTALASSDWTLSYELMMKPRFRADLLEDLMCQASVYLYANNLAMPESSDPWYFLPSDTPIERFLSVAGQELTKVGCDVFVSRSISEYRAWFEASRRPPDSVMLPRAYL